jgi:glucose uptake protein GlcU
MDEPATLDRLEGVFNNLVQSILGFAGIVLFIFLIIGGFKFITSAGDPKALEEAKKTLSYAIMGLVLLLVSYLVLVLIEQITGAPVTDFKVTL